ncbi:SDR family NAD(P)-dependent oxidoreductase [Nonomuraea thailandensis]
MARTWLITGASRGFGRRLTEAVLDAGDRVVATARSPKQLDDLVARHGDRIRAVALDVTDAAAASRAVEEATTAFGRLDVVVNNAGYGNSAPIEEMAEDDFRAQIETNFFGVVNVTRAALPVLRTQRSGVFVQFSSIGGRVGGTPGMGAYQSAKFAVEGFSEVLARRSRPSASRSSSSSRARSVPTGRAPPWRSTPSAPTTRRPWGPSTATGARPTAPSPATRPARRGSSSTSSATTTRRGGSCWAATPSPPPSRRPGSAPRRPRSGRREPLGRLPRRRALAAPPGQDGPSQTGRISMPAPRGQWRAISSASSRSAQSMR